MSTDMLEDIRDGVQSHPIINSTEERYRICDSITQRQVECKGKLLSTQKWVNFYTRYLRLLLMIFDKHYQFWVNLDHKFLTSFQNLETW